MKVPSQLGVELLDCLSNCLVEGLFVKAFCDQFSSWRKVGATSWHKSITKHHRLLRRVPIGRLNLFGFTLIISICDFRYPNVEISQTEFLKL